MRAYQSTEEDQLNSLSSQTTETEEILKHVYAP